MDYNPEVAYLGKTGSEKHLAVAWISWKAVLSEMQLRHDDIFWKKKSGYLAMELSPNHEPHFVGIIWLKDARHMPWNRVRQTKFSLNEIEEVFGIKDIQRFVHLAPFRR